MGLGRSLHQQGASCIDVSEWIGSPRELLHSESSDLATWDCQIISTGELLVDVRRQVRVLNVDSLHVIYADSAPTLSNEHT